MTKEYIYMVNGREFTDTEAFGNAWKQAQEVAKEEHTIITRLVATDFDERFEFLAKGWVFLPERFYTKERAVIL